MSNKLKYLLYIILLTIAVKPAMATHLLGGEIVVCQMGSNEFEIKTFLFRDCNAGSVAAPSTIQLKVYEVDSTNAFGSFTMTQNSFVDVTPAGDACFSPTGLCVEEYTYITTVTLPDNPRGYYMTYSFCCRNGAIVNLSNPLSVGSTFYTQIPDPALTGGNCTPVTAAAINESYWCVGYDYQIPLQATDSDMDSLSYTLVDPNSQSSTVPIPPVAFAAGYSISNVLGNLTFPPMSIDPVSGDLSFHPEMIGIYSFSILIKEYRSGALIGETIQEYQITCLNGCSPSPPVANVQMVDVSCFAESDGEIIVESSGGTGTGYEISIDGGASYQSQSTNPDTLIVGTGSYFVIVADTNNCTSDTIPASIQEPDKIQFNVNVVPDTCSRGVGFVEVANITGGNGNIYVYSIDLGAAAQISPFFQVEAGNYTVIGADTNGCFDFIMATVPDEVGELNAGGFLGPYVSCPNEPIYIEAVGGDTYDWLNQNVVPEPNGAATVVLDSSQMIFVEIYSGSCSKLDSTLIVISTNECEAGVISNNVFSPDGDGVNEGFVLDIPQLLKNNNTVIIYNKWGDIIKEFVNYNNNDVIWDGKNKAGVDVSAGTYFYVIEIPEANYSNSGWVQLIR